MPTVTIDLTEVNKIPGQGRVAEIEAVQNGKHIIRVVSLDDFPTWATFAGWLINQEPDRVSQADWRKRLTITFHAEQITDPETGQIMTIKVIDNVVVGELPA